MKRPLVLLVAVLAACLGTVAPLASAAGERATFAKVSDWGSGWEGRITVTNGGTTPITSWRVEFDLPAGTSIGTYWDALLTSSGSHHTFANREYNGSLAPGASVSFGFNGAGPGAPLNCRVNGADCGGGGTDPQPGAPGVPGGLRVTGTTTSSITLGWSAASGTVSGYRLYEGATARATVTGTSATIGGLAPCTSRTLTVAAFNDVGESAHSVAVTATTAGCQVGNLPRHFLTGYWHNFVNPATELRLSAVPDEYDLVAVAFAEAAPTPGAVTFGVDPGLSSALGGYTNDQFKADVASPTDTRPASPPTERITFLPRACRAAMSALNWSSV